MDQNFGSLPYHHHKFLIIFFSKFVLQNKIHILTQRYIFCTNIDTEEKETPHPLLLNSWSIIEYFFSVSSILTQILDDFSKGKNYALGQPAYQTSTGPCCGGIAARAVDGNKNTNMAVGSCTNTNAGSGEWWRVDLGISRPVFQIVLVSRDCCTETLQTFNIYVGDSANYAVLDNKL